MGDNVIEEIKVIETKRIAHPQGDILHYVKKEYDFSRELGEVYFSQVNPFTIKGWKVHREIVQHLFVPMGRVEFTIVDLRQGESRKIVLDENAPSVLIIPCGLWYAFKNLNDSQSLIANYLHEPFRSDESETMNIEDDVFKKFL